MFHRTIRISLRVCGVLLLFLLLSILAINIPAVQTILAQKFIKSLKEKTGTEISIGSIKLAFPRTVNISNIYIQDLQKDTLMYLYSLKANIELSNLLRNKLTISSLELENLVSHIHRKGNEDKFNFQFILDALSTAEPDTTTKSSPWLISAGKIVLKNTHASFIDDRSGIDTRADLESFEANIKDFDLDKKLIGLDKYAMKNASLRLTLAKQETKETEAIETANVSEEAITTSFFSTWNISARQFDLENTTLRFDANDSARKGGEFDAQHILASHVNASIKDITISKDGYAADIKNMSLAESCGLNLQKLSGKAILKHNAAEIKNLQLETQASNISANIKLTYDSLNNLFINKGGKILVDIKNSKLNATEVFMIIPALSDDSNMSKFMNSDVNITAKAAGSFDNINLENLELSALNKTTLRTHGRIIGINNPKTLYFDITIDQLSSALPDLYRLINPKVLAGIHLPNLFSIKGTAIGKPDSLRANLQFSSSYGVVSANTFYQIRNYKPDSIHVIFSAKDILVGVLLGDSLLGKASASGEIGLTGIAKGPLSGSANTMIEELRYNSYTYKNIHIESSKNGDIVSAKVKSDDPNIHFNLTADGNLNRERKTFSVDLDLSRVELQKLNFIQQDFVVSTNLNAAVNYVTLNNADAKLSLINTRFRSLEKTAAIDTLEISANSTPQGLDVQIHSDMADGKMAGNITSDSLVKTFRDAFGRYFSKTDTSVLQPGNHLSFALNIHKPKDFAQLFLPELDTLEITKLEGDYKSDNNQLTAQLEAPRIKYSKMVFDSLTVTMSGQNNKLSLDLGFNKMQYNKMYIESFRMKEKTDHGNILSEISILDTGNVPRYFFANELETGKDFFKLRFLPEGLILDSKPWKVEDDNMLIRQKGEFSSRQFIFKKDNQSFGFIAEGGNQKLVFKDFSLTNIMKMVSMTDSTQLIKGNVNGEIVFSPAGEQQYVNTDITVNNLYILDTLAGNITLKLKTDKDKADVNVQIENEQNTIRVTGNVADLSETPLYNLDMAVDIKNLQRLQPFTFGNLSKMTGRLGSRLSLKGTRAKPEVDGYINFDEAAFKINSLNFFLKINHEKITISEKAIHFNNFSIEDSLAKKLVINGDVLFKDKLSNPEFNLSLVAKDFQPINSSASDNDLFYGKLSVNTDIKLKGNLKSPEIDAKIKVDSTTNLTYVLPGSELKLVTSEGIVEFRDSTQTEDSVLAGERIDYITDSIMGRVSGIILSSNLQIDSGARFTINIDPKSGDYLTLSGKAKLDISSDGTGNQSISGMYEISSGYYQLSFYDLIKKKFELKPGSTISWSGRPMDAELNITAGYLVRASSVALVANETSGMSDEEKKIFNQRLPYEIKLNIHGLLAKPEISFNIILPSQYLAANPLVATKLAALNSPEMAAELNKQVFALLVTGSFLAENPMATTGSTSNNIASTAARNSVNGILSNQLNNISSKYVSGVDINFDLTSYEDYSGGSNQTRTEMEIQVSKKLFNDRVTVEAQNSFGLKNKNEATTTAQQYGQFAVTYTLTETGEYKLRAFYQDMYDPFDGEITVSGIALIFEKELDSLKKKK